MSIGKEASNEAKEKLHELLHKFEGIWKEPKPGCCKVERHHIDTGDTTPITCKPRRLPQVHREEVKAQVVETLVAGAIRES